MATISNDGFTWIKNWANGQPSVKTEIKAWGLSKPTLKAALQAVEDYMVNGFSNRPATSIRAAIEAVTGPTTSLRAQTIYVMWAAWRIYLFLGGT